jgi:hypothetical protein
MTDASQPRTWEMFATRRQNPNSYPFFMHIGPERQVRQRAPKADVVLRVRLIEDAAGEYRGWIPTGRTQKPQRVSLARFFNMDFKLGYSNAKVKAAGEVIYLRVEEIEA